MAKTINTTVDDKDLIDRSRVNSEELEDEKAVKKEEPEEVAGTPSRNDVKTVSVSESVKRVRVIASEEVDCWIGGAQYKMVERKEYLVPADVAAILCNSKKAYRK